MSGLWTSQIGRRVGVCRVRLVGIQSIPSNALTAIAFDTETEDTDNAWAVGDPTKIYMPSWVNRARAVGNILFPDTAAADSIRLTLHKNNVSFAETPAQHLLANNVAGDPTSHLAVTSGIFTVVGGTDYLSMKFRHTNAAAQDAGSGAACWLCVEFWRQS